MRDFGLASIVAFVIMWASSVDAADTVQDFTSTFPDPTQGLERLSSSSGGLGTPPSIVAGWDGSAVQITHDGQGGQNNWVAWDERIAGGYSALNLSFDIRFEGAGVSGEGLGFGLLNTAEYGQRPSAGLSWQPDEPNLTGSLGIGFDLVNQRGIDPLDVTNLLDSVSLHYDGAVVQQSLTSNLVDTNGAAMPEDWLELGGPIGVDVDILPVPAGGANVSVTLIDRDSARVVNAFQNVNLPNFSAYEARLAFGGRTIGIDSSMEVDNVSYNRNGTNVLVDDFESYGEGSEIPPLPPSEPVIVGGTPFVLQRTEGEPGPTIARDEEGAGVHPARLQLTQEVPGTRNYAFFDKTSDDTSRIDATFDFRIKNVTNLSADGMAFVLGDTAVYGDQGEFVPGSRPWFEAEEPNLMGGLGIGFDTFDNDEEGEFDPTGCGGDGTCEDSRANHVSLHWDGERLGDIVLIDRDELDLVGDEWHQAHVLVEQGDEGMVVSVTIRDGVDGSVHEVMSDVLVPNAQFPGAARAAFGARTGDAFDIHEIDNVLIRFGPVTQIEGDFNANGFRDVGDLDLLASAMMANDPSFDLDGDGDADLADRTHWVEVLANTYSGDVDLNGEFNSSDMVQVFIAGKYETGQPATWAEGDFNGDKVFDSGDLVTAFIGGGYEVGPRPGVAAQVPEPAGTLLLTAGLILVVHARRHHRSSRGRSEAQP
jgi:hypothetical protein